MVFMLVHYSNMRSQFKYKTQRSSLLWTRRLTSYSHEKPTQIKIPLYSNTSESRVLKPSSEIHNFIVWKIYYLYKKEFYKNSFKKVNIHVSPLSSPKINCSQRPQWLPAPSGHTTISEEHHNSKTAHQSFSCHKYT